MLERSLDLVSTSAARVVIAILREHVERFDAARGIARVLGDATDVVVLEEPTASQAHTVAAAIDAAAIEGPFLVKDSDNQFELSDVEATHNYVCVDSLNEHDQINPRNKSYVQVDDQDRIINIREKTVISDLFSVGGYYFADVDHYRETFSRLDARLTEWHKELYLSDVIGSMILDGELFAARRVCRYRDWGTIHEWREELASRQTLFVSLDGVLFERGSLHFHPKFEEVTPFPTAVDDVRRARADGHSVIALSIRPASLSALTLAQLDAVGLAGLHVVFGCPIGPWRLVTARHATVPVTSGTAAELEPDDPYFGERLLGR